jgi:1-propanol dehydrogenase
MEIFTLKPKLFFGAHALDALGELANRRVLVVTDGFLASSALLDRVRERLTGCAVTVFDQVEPDPSLELVAQGVRVLQECRPEAVVAFGGGSPMDCAKAVRWSAGSAVPLWAVPTTAGTGSEMTSFAVVTDRSRGVKHPLVDDALLPEYAVLDPSLLDDLPPAVVADTGMDVLAHALEAAVSTAATAFTDALAEKAFTLAYQNLPAAYAAVGPSPAKEAMLYASCLAGMAFNAAGLGVCHSLSHALGGRLHLPHGRLNAALLPHVVAYNAAQSAAGEKYAHLAKLCGLVPASRALSGALNRLLTALKLPKTLPIDDPKAAAQAALDDRCTATNPRTPTQADLERLLRACTG